MECERQIPSQDRPKRLATYAVFVVGYPTGGEVNKGHRRGMVANTCTRIHGYKHPGTFPAARCEEDFLSQRVRGMDGFSGSQGSMR